MPLNLRRENTLCVKPPRPQNLNENPSKKFNKLYFIFLVADDGLIQRIEGASFPEGN